MPDVSPYPGWTTWKALSSLDPGQLRGSVEDLPARGLRWSDEILEDLGTGYHHWLITLELRDAGGTLLLAQTLDLPITVLDLGPFGSVWYVQNETLTTTFPESVTTWENQSPQPVLLYQDGEDFSGPVRFTVVSTGYLVSVPAGSVFRVTRGEVGNTALRFEPIFTSVLAGGKTTRMLIDNTTANRHVFRVLSGKELVMFTWDNSEDRLDGRRSGLEVTYAGGAATVSAGTMRLARRDITTGALSLPDLTPPCYVFLALDDSGEPQLLAGTGAISDRAAGLLAKIAANGAVTALEGVLVATGVTEHNVGRGADGLFVVHYDTASEQDQMVVSRDRGVRWG